jgi:hypothetical protein
MRSLSLFYGELPEVNCYIGQINQLFMNNRRGSSEKFVDALRLPALKAFQDRERRGRETEDKFRNWFTQQSYLERVLG